MTKLRISSGVVHKVPSDLGKTLALRSDILKIWNELTPLARKEWICWVISVKKSDTRKQHIDRLSNDLLKGKRRPCCWIGCRHRQN